VTVTLQDLRTELHVLLQAFHGCCSSGRSHASAAQYEAIPESIIFRR